MKTLLVGDIHLKARLILPILDTVIKDRSVERVIFLGDDVDLHGQSKNIKLYAEDLTFLYEWKNNIQDKGVEIINLVGNHDIYYLLGLPSPFSIQNLEVFFAVQKLLEDLDLQIAYQLDDYLVSHAGYNFLFDTEPWHFEPIQVEKYEKELEILAYAVGPMRGGGDLAGSPLWADFREIEIAANIKYPKQIVGHTPKSSIDISKNIIGLDTFSLSINAQNTYEYIGNGDLLFYELGTLQVIPTNWISRNIIKSLPNPLKE